jgi:hypothetical protein
MLTLAMPVDAHPVCADPQYLTLVDAAFEQPGGPESHWMRNRLCTACTLRLECLLLGNAKGEHGIWGGLSAKQRVEAGGRPARSPGGAPRNLKGLHPHGPPKAA